MFVVETHLLQASKDWPISILMIPRTIVAEDYLSMDAIERVIDQEQTRRMVGAHTFTWFVPRKPRVSVRVHDAASGERVIGVRYRVMSHAHMQPAPARRVSFGGTQVIHDAVPQVRQY